MRGIIAVIVRLIRAGQLAYTKRWSFFALFAIVFVGSVFALASFDLLPDAPPASPVVAHSSVQTDEIKVSAGQQVVAEFPTKIEIARINLSTTISNPTTTDIRTLDKELLKGAVRYPTTAKLGEDGNLVLFGHSSYLPVVGNKAYKAFNDIQKLKAGDVVTVYSSTTAYTYRVRSLTKENASTAGIPLSVTGRVLTLSTCDSFGTVTDRWVVVADFVDSYSIQL